jgi:hypothetical protein
LRTPAHCRGPVFRILRARSTNAVRTLLDENRTGSVQGLHATPICPGGNRGPPDLKPMPEKTPRNTKAKELVRPAAAVVPAYIRPKGPLGARAAPRKGARRAAAEDFNDGNRMVDLSPLKIAVRVLPVNSSVRMLVLDEPDLIPLQEFATKIQTWYKLMVNPDRQ